LSGLRETLEAIRVEQGILTPAGVVAAAEPVDSPLHDRFEWDDAAAAYQYRVEQARELIRSVRVSYTDGAGHPATARGFVSVSRGDAPAREYVPVEEVAMDPMMRKLMLRDAEREWRTLKAKYDNLEEFTALVAADVIGAVA
jgi:hypothetical protein